MTSAVRCSVGRPVVADGSVAAGFSGASSGGRFAVGGAGGTAGLVDRGPGERTGVVVASGGAACSGCNSGRGAAGGGVGWTGVLAGAGARSSPVPGAGEVPGRAPNRIQPSSPLGTRTLDHSSCSSKIVNSMLLAVGTVATIAYCSPGPARNVMDGRSPAGVAGGLTGADLDRRAMVKGAGGTVGLGGAGARSSPVPGAGELTGPAPNVRGGRSPEGAGTGSRTRASMSVQRSVKNHVQTRQRFRCLDDIARSFYHLWSSWRLVHSLSDASETDRYRHP